MEDEEDFISPLDFATLSGMARQADAQVQTQIKNYRDMITAGTKRMREQRLGPSSTERLLALAQALGSPTTTGKFGERIGLVAGTLGSQQRAQREAELARADTLEKLGLTRIRDRNWYVQPACASTGDGLYEGLTWLTSNHKS